MSHATRRHQAVEFLALSILMTGVVLVTSGCGDSPPKEISAETSKLLPAEEEPEVKAGESDEGAPRSDPSRSSDDGPLLDPFSDVPAPPPLDTAGDTEGQGSPSATAENTGKFRHMPGLILWH